MKRGDTSAFETHSLENKSGTNATLLKHTHSPHLLAPQASTRETWDQIWLPSFFFLFFPGLAKYTKNCFNVHGKFTNNYMANFCTRYKWSSPLFVLIFLQRFLDPKLHGKLIFMHHSKFSICLWKI